MKRLASAFEAQRGRQGVARLRGRSARRAKTTSVPGSGWPTSRPRPLYRAGRGTPPDPESPPRAPGARKGHPALEQLERRSMVVPRSTGGASARECPPGRPGGRRPPCRPGARRPARLLVGLRLVALAQREELLQQARRQTQPKRGPLERRESRRKCCELRVECVDPLSRPRRAPCSRMASPESGSTSVAWPSSTTTGAMLSSSSRVRTEYGAAMTPPRDRASPPRSRATSVPRRAAWQPQRRGGWSCPAPSPGRAARPVHAPETLRRTRAGAS